MERTERTAPSKNPRVETHSPVAAGAGAKPSAPDRAPVGPPGANSPPARHSFYRSRTAAALAMLFTVVALVAIGLALQGHLSVGSRWRLCLVVLPGTTYLVWRVIEARR